VSSRTPGSGASTRRGLLAGAPAVLAGTALGLAGCGSQQRHVTVSRRLPAQASELQTLNELRSVELLAITAYTAGIPRLGRQFYWTAKQLLADEVAHAAQLYGLIRHRGGEPTNTPTSYDLGNPRSPRQVLELFASLERLQVSGYLRAIPVMPSGRVRSVLGAILGSDAQHQALVRQALGGPALAGPYVSG
jgi:hypothetical protein